MKKSFLMLLCTAIALPSIGQTVKGPRYRGFVDGTFLVGNDGVYASGFNMKGGGFTTTHGYQINDHIFVGGGVGYYRMSYDMEGDYDYFGETDYSYDIVPVYTNFRYQIARCRVSPFIDVKLGSAISDDIGLYFSPSTGVRIGLAGKMGLNITMGYTAMQGMVYDEDLGERVTHSLNLSVGIDF